MQSQQRLRPLPGQHWTRVSGAVLAVLALLATALVAIPANPALAAEFQPRWLPTFTTQPPMLNARATHTLQLPDGGLLVAGDFDVPSSRLAKFHADGAPDVTFNSGIATTFDGAINDLSLLADGSVLVAGDFLTPAPYLTKISATGVPDTLFTSNVGGLNGAVQQVITFTDGSHLIAGEFTQPGNYVAKLNADGTVNDEFAQRIAGQVNGPVHTMLSQPDNSILLGGSFTAPTAYLSKLDAAGSIVSDFTSPSSEPVWQLAPVPEHDSFLLVTGQSAPVVVPPANPTTETGTPAAGTPDTDTPETPAAETTTPTSFSLSRANSRGEIDADFATNSFTGAVLDVIALTSGDVIVAGELQNPNAPWVALNSKGQASPLLESLATPSITGPIHNLNYDASSGQVVLAGSFSSVFFPFVATAEISPALPTEPVPTEPAETAPTPAEPAPAETAPTPAEPAPAETEPAPAELAPTAEPAPAETDSGSDQPQTPAPVIDEATVPPSGLNVTDITAGYQQAEVRFDYDEQAAVIAQLEYRVNQGPWQIAAETAADGRLFVPNLTNGETATVSVRGVNRAGEGPATPPAPVTPQGATFTPLSPVRVLDTRQDGQQLQPQSPRVVELRGKHGIANNAVAIAYNVTVTGTVGAGYVSITPSGTKSAQATSTINWTDKNQTWANGHISGLGADGAITAAAGVNPSHLVLDVVGYFTPATTPSADNASVFVPLTPSRTFDSRTGVGNKLVGGQSRAIDMTANNQVPAQATAVAYNLTQTDTTGAGYLALAPMGSPRPETSNLNFWGDSQITANSSISGIVDGQSVLYVGPHDQGATTHAVIDILGYFIAPDLAPEGALFSGITPERAYDSRTGTPAGPLRADQSFTTSMQVTGVPDSAVAFAYNLTETNTVGAGFLTIAPGHVTQTPHASSINWWQSGQTMANGSIIAANATTSNTDIPFAVNTFAGVGSTDYLIDVDGYFHGPDPVDVSRVTVAGPHGLQFSGIKKVYSPDKTIIDIDSATGSVAGMALVDAPASGQIRAIDDVSTMDVSVTLDDHPLIVPTWEQQAHLRLRMAPNATTDIRTTVEITSQRGSNWLELSGPLAKDSIYELAATGQVTIGGVPISLTGDYHGTESRDDHTWHITGSSDTVGGFDDVQLHDLRIDMTQRNPGVTGTTHLRAADLGAAADIDFGDTDSWQLTLSKGSPQQWQPSELPGLTVAFDQVQGVIHDADGQISWDLRAPMQLRQESLTYSGQILMRAQNVWTLEIDAVTGSIPGANGETTFDEARGKVEFNQGQVTGSIEMTTAGAAMLPLKNTWSSKTFITSVLESATGSSMSISQENTNGGSFLNMTGQFQPDHAYELSITGELTIAGTQLPISGVYQSTGYMHQGQPRPEPYWHVSGNIADVVGGRLKLAGGAALVGGSLGMQGRGTPIADDQVVQMRTPATGTPAVGSTQTVSADDAWSDFSGEVEIELGDGSNLVLTGTMDFTDENNWSIELGSQSQKYWSPPGIPGLTINLATITGTITATEGDITYDVRVAEMTWENVVTGANLTTEFAISNTCIMDSHCPSDDSGIYLSFVNGELTFADPVPTMQVNGSIRTDGSWARFSADVGEVTFNGIGISNAGFTLWKGERGDSYDEGLDMPDLSAANNGLNVEFCGNFVATIPDVTTLDTGGCVVWSPEGIVIGQLNPGGEIDAGESNGVSLDGITLDGFAWTNLPTSPRIVLDGVELLLVKDRYELTSTMHIPAALSKATGGADKPISIPATGWWQGSDFNLTGDIEVNMRSGGFTLHAISVEVGKEGNHFQLGFGADADVSVSGNHFPLSAYVGVAGGGGSSEIVVRVEAQGAVSADPNGGFDLPSLLPSGNFEPVYSSEIDGNFDARAQKSVLADGDFENAVDSENLLTNGNFEDGSQDSLLDDGGFESGMYSNLLANSDFEDTDVLLNGDFERGDLQSWYVSSNYAAVIADNTTAPTEDRGTVAVTVSNNNSSGSQSNTGLYQTMPWQAVAGANYEASAWIKSTSAKTTRVALTVQQFGTATGCPTQATVTTSQTFTVDNTKKDEWLRIAVPVQTATCRSFIKIIVNPVDAKTNALVDAVQLNVTNASTAVDVPNTFRPDRATPTNFTGFDTMPPISKSGNAYLTTDAGNPGGSLRSDGDGESWLFNSGSWGQRSGDFSVSYDVYFPKNGSTDKLDMGFWITGSGGKATGYLFRTQINAGDGGFYRINNHDRGRVSGDTDLPALSQDVWHRVDLSTSGSYATAVVTRLDSGTVIHTKTIKLPDGNRAGVFGQLSTNKAASSGSRLDNFRFNSGPRVDTAVRFDAAGAHTGSAYLAAKSTATNWSLLTATQEAPVQGETYSYGGWARSTSGTVNGNIVLRTEGGTEDVTSMPVTIGTSWTYLEAAMDIRNADHTNLLVGFESITSANVEVRFDDMHLQRLPVTMSPSTRGAMKATIIDDASRAHTGLASLALTDNNNLSTASLTMAPPTSGSTYTASAWMRSDAVVSGYLILQADGPSPTQYRVPFSTNNSWQQFKVNLPISRTDHTNLKVSVEIASGNRGRTVYVDDVDVQGQKIVLPQESEVVWGTDTIATFDKLPPISTSANVKLATDFGNPIGSLRSDGKDEWWLFNKGSWGDVSGDFDVSYDVYFPYHKDRDMVDLGFFTTGSGSKATGYLFRVQTYDNDGGFYRINNHDRSRVSNDKNLSALPHDTWHRVRLTTVGSQVTATVTRLSTGAVVHTHTVTLPSGNRAGAFGQLSTNNGSGSGSRLDNFTVYKASSTGVTPMVMKDASNAHAGDGYMQLIPPNGLTAAISRKAAVNLAVGNTYNARIWVRAPGSSAKGKLLFSTEFENTSASFTANNTWQLVEVNLPVTKASTQGITVKLEHNTSGQGLYVDDASVSLIGLSQPDAWTAVPDSGGSLSTVIWNKAENAHGGSKYLEATAKSKSGTLRKDSSVSVASGSQYTASAWVKATSSTKVQGVLTLAIPGSSQTKSSNFTATGTWQQVFVTLPVSSSGDTTLRTDLRLTTTGAGLAIDDVTVTPVADWAPTGPAGVAIDEVVLTSPGDAATGNGFLRVRAAGPQAGVKARSTTPVVPGTTYTMVAYVRSASGGSLGGTMSLGGTGTSPEQVTHSFTATPTWTWQELKFTATKSNNELVPQILVGATGTLDVDGIVITPDVIVQPDPWVADTGGGSVAMTVLEDPERAHDSLGLMVLKTSGGGTNGIRHDIALTPAVGDYYTGSVWIRSQSGTPVAGRFELTTLGGSSAPVSATFQADSAWQLVSVRLPITSAGHTGLRARVLSTTPGVELDVDDVNVGKEIWRSFSSGPALSQVQVNDGAAAESGSGFLRITKGSAGEAGVQNSTPGNLAAGSAQTMSAYVRSTSGAAVTGQLRLNSTGGGATQTVSAPFTATAEWRKVSVTLTVSGTGRNALLTQVLVDEAGQSLDIDTVTVAQEPVGKPDGITTPLPHPETGYAYLWRDAFGISGAHLWALSAQITLINGAPGLGVGATMYFDPTKMPGVMSGTDWLKGDMTVNVSRAEPCFSFGFDASGTNTRVSIDDGMFEASRFNVSFAPRGCEVGSYVVPIGSSLGLDTELGDAQFRMDLAIGRDDKNLPTFTTDMALYDLKLGGMVYNAMELQVRITAQESNTHFLGDFTLPMGKFYGEFDLSRNPNSIHMAGDVTVSDWQLSGGSFDVSRFNYRQVTDIPLGANSCANFNSATSGDMSMGGKRYVFAGELAVDCGTLKVLHIEFDYMKRNVAYRFMLDYNSKTRELAGELGFKFQRKTSWRFVGIRYKRSPKFEIMVEFRMRVDKPSSAQLKLYGAVTLSGGSGAVDCALNTGGDDGCDLIVQVRVFGGHTYRSSW